MDFVCITNVDQNLVYRIMQIGRTDYSFFTQWLRFRVKHLPVFIRSKGESQLCVRA